ncbi:uncharacterized protein LOC135375523 [Ornithodoros turicata]|uniref:uncharacterized protein LOC135375523 n=1 Tax=Ornithodoros turicata TaxID=34597 RepID=UPI003139BCB5
MECGYKLWVIVEFLGEEKISAVPKPWLNENESECKWPTTMPDQKRDDMIQRYRQPGRWKSFAVRVIGRSTSYAAALKTMEKSLYTSSVESQSDSETSYSRPLEASDAQPCTELPDRQAATQSSAHEDIVLPEPPLQLRQLTPLDDMVPSSVPIPPSRTPLPSQDGAATSNFRQRPCTYTRQPTVQGKAPLRELHNCMCTFHIVASLVLYLAELCIL